MTIFQPANRVLSLLVISLLIVSCSKAPELHLLSGSTMGTSWSVKIVSDMETQGLQPLIERRLEEIEQAMSNWREDSEISRFNRIGAGCQLLSEDTQTVVSASLEISQQSEGYFDPTLSPLIDLWGFGTFNQPPEAPEQDQLDQIMVDTGYEHLSLVDGQLCKAMADIHLNLSAIAKGYALDALALELQEAGFDRFLVEVGGELFGTGLNAENELWTIGIEKPSYGISMEVHTVLELDSMAVATSGDYRNYYELNGKRYSHILDSQTGSPVTHPGASVTVLHSSAMYADGWATALLAAGPEKGIILAEEYKLPVLFINRVEDTLLTIESGYWP